MTTSVASLSEVLDEWVEGLSKADRKLVEEVKYKRYSKKLARLASAFRDHLDKSENSVVKEWLAEVVSEIVVAVPHRSLCVRHPGLWELKQHLNFVMYSVGPILDRPGWYIRQDKTLRDPTSLILRDADIYGQINASYARRLYDLWGLPRDLHAQWLTRIPGVRAIDGQFVILEDEVADQTVFGLHSLGRPSRVEDIRVFVTSTVSKASVIAAMKKDSRVKRVSESRWGLTEWGETDGAGVYILEDLLKQMDAPLAVSDLPQGVNSNDCNAPMFIVEKGTIRLRGGEDPEYKPSLKEFYYDTSVFRLGSKIASYVHAIDYETFKCTSVALPESMACILGISHGTKLNLQGPDGQCLTLDYMDTSSSSPMIRPLQPLLLGLRLSPLDYMTLVLDTNNNTFRVQITKSNVTYAGFERIKLLTGLKATDSKAMAYALKCMPDEVCDVLSARNEKQLLKEFRKIARKDVVS